jgi:RND family efflux transporter MFP subunit
LTPSGPPGSGAHSTVGRSGALPEKKARWFIVAAALIVVSAGAALLAWTILRPAEIDILTVTPAPLERVLAVVGRVRPTDLVDVRSPNPGQVLRLLRDDGDRVAAGEPLAVIKSVVEQAQTDAGVARERAALAELRRSQLAFERIETLARSGFAATAALDEARAARQSAQANLDAARATTAASAAVTQEFTVRSPMDGIVLFRPIDSGQVISTTTTLFELGSLKGTEIQAQVDESYADALRPGLAARAVLTGGSEVFPATVMEVSPKIDSTTGGRLIKLAPLNDRTLAPGRSVDVTIVVERRSRGIVIPRSAVLNSGSAPRVYALDADNMVRERSVRILRWPSLNAIVEDGLEAGDRIVLAPAGTRPGARVRPAAAPDQRGD